MDKNLLTSIFHQNGYLDGAKVKSIELKPKATNGIASEFYMANLSYSSDSHKLPNRMIIKRPLLGDRGEGEARVYEQILRGEADLPVLKCFGVVDDDPDKPLSLFFEDLSDTHYQSEWPLIPSLTNCRLAVTTLARVHAHWWGKHIFDRCGYTRCSKAPKLGTSKEFLSRIRRSGRRVPF